MNTVKKLIIPKDRLRMAVEAVFEKIENNIDSEIEISNDYYLTIPMDEAIDVTNDVKPAVGSLFDDWENPDRLVGKIHPATFVDLDRLAAILRAISREMNPPERT